MMTTVYGVKDERCMKSPRAELLMHRSILSRSLWERVGRKKEPRWRMTRFVAPPSAVSYLRSSSWNPMTRWKAQRRRFCGTVLRRVVAFSSSLSSTNTLARMYTYRGYPNYLNQVGQRKKREYDIIGGQKRRRKRDQ